jgi:hypothetical protein
MHRPGRYDLRQVYFLVRGARRFLRHVLNGFVDFEAKYLDSEITALSGFLTTYMSPEVTAVFCKG